MNEFKAYHPIVNFIYFTLVIGFGCFLMHPICLIISFVCGFTYSLMLRGVTATKKSLLFILPVVIVMAIINPLFNHKGMTVLGYLPSGNPLTLEAVIYGLLTGLMIFSVICHFLCYNEIMTSDKFIYLFGKAAPSLSLILSMTFRLVPKFSAQLKLVADTQRCIGRDASSGGIIKRIKRGLTLLSIVTTWALENSIETADSMKARGYGLSGRTAFSVFSFDKRDAVVVITILTLGIYTLVGGIAGEIKFSYYPTLKGTDFSLYGLSVFIAYAALCVLPIIIEIWGEQKWKVLKSKI